MMWSHRDCNNIWHPFSPLGEENIPIIWAEGAYLYSSNGRKIFDGISSWWVNLFGHSHPKIVKKISGQVHILDQILFAGLTHRGAIELAEKLLSRSERIQIQGHGGRVFYSDNGSTSVEMALKMAIQYWYQRGEKRKKILAFKDGYHGDTFGSMGVSSRGIFNKPFWDFLFEVEFIAAPTNQNGSLCIEQVHHLFERGQHLQFAAFIFEPMVQGAGGMKMQNPHILNELVTLVQASGIPVITDEVMTGMGRTGTLFASQQANLTNCDFICLSKGVTGGMLPLGVTLIHEKIVNQFENKDQHQNHNIEDVFFHGHSYTGNPLSIACANETLELIQDENYGPSKWKMIENAHLQFKNKIELHAEAMKKISEIRILGTILAIELNPHYWSLNVDQNCTYLFPLTKKIKKYFLDRDLLIRPLGNVIYLMPPYCVEIGDLDSVYLKLSQFLDDPAFSMSV